MPFLLFLLQEFENEQSPGYSNRVLLDFMKAENLHELREFLASGKARIEDKDEVSKMFTINFKLRSVSKYIVSEWNHSFDACLCVG